MLRESAYQLAQLSDRKNITAASSSILRIFLDSAYEQKTSILYKWLYLLTPR